MHSRSHHSKSHENLTESDPLAAAVATALTHLSKAQAVLPLDDDLIERDRQAAVALIKYPTQALQAAAEILAAEPQRLASFDASAVSDALAYDVAMTKVLRQAEALVTAVQRSLWKRRAPGVEQTLALYAWLKRGSRRINGSLGKYADALQPHVVFGGRKPKTKKAQPSTQGPPASSTGETPAPPPEVHPNSGASAPATTH